MTLVALLLACGGADRPEAAERPAWGAARRTQSGKYLVAVRALAEPLPMGELFAMEATVTDPSGAPVPSAGVTIDARMPQHNHGMETKPVPREVVCDAPGPRGCPHPDGVYVSDGFKFHMAGSWTVLVDVNGPVGLDSTSFVVDVASGRPR